MAVGRACCANDVKNVTRLAPYLGWLSLGALAVALLAPARQQLMDHFVHHDEALMILMGRAVLEGRPCDGACAQHTGSVMTQPVLAAWGDRWGGLYGARLVGVGCGLVLLAGVVAMGWLLLDRTGGLLAGALLLLQAPYLYVSRMALYDVVASCAFSLALVCLLAADRRRTSAAEGVATGWWLAMAAIAFVLAGIAKYVALIYLPLALVVVCRRFRLRTALAWFVLPVLGLSGWYVWEALLPVLGQVVEQLARVSWRGQESFTRVDTLGLLARWLFWPSLLAAAGVAFASGRSTYDGAPSRMGHAQPSADGVTPALRRWRISLVLFAAALPLAHLITGGIEGLNKNVVQPLIVLAPLGAFGLLEFTRPLKAAGGPVARWGVIGAVLLLMLVGVVRSRAWLEHQYPDLSPVVAELRRLVTDKSIVMTDTDALYRYLLSDRLDANRIVLTYWVDHGGETGEAGALRFLEEQGPDIVVLDGYYGHADQHQRLRTAMGTGYVLRRQWPITLSWGERTVELYARKGEAA